MKNIQRENKQLGKTMISMQETCRLCLRSTSEVGKLQQSHSIPRGMLLKSKNDGKALVFNADDKSYKLSQEDWKEKMLCEMCERLINIEYEELIYEVLVLRRKTSVINQLQNLVLLNVSVDKLALALISIFWRAAVAHSVEYRMALAPDYMLETMRSWLLKKSAGTEWSRLITIKLQELLADDGRTMHFIVPPFHRGDTVQLKQYQFVFIFGGFCITFGIPTLADDSHVQQHTLMPFSPVVIERVHYTTIPEIEQLTRAMHATRLPLGVDRKIKQLMNKRRAN